MHIEHELVSAELLLWWLSVKESICNAGFNLRVRENPWSRKWKPAPVSYQGNPIDRGAWRLQSIESPRVDTTERLYTAARTPCQLTNERSQPLPASLHFSDKASLTQLFVFSPYCFPTISFKNEWTLKMKVLQLLVIKSRMI